MLNFIVFNMRNCSFFQPNELFEVYTIAIEKSGVEIIVGPPAKKNDR